MSEGHGSLSVSLTPEPSVHLTPWAPALSPDNKPHLGATLSLPGPRPSLLIWGQKGPGTTCDSDMGVEGPWDILGQGSFKLIVACDLGH